MRISEIDSFQDDADDVEAIEMLNGESFELTCTHLDRSSGDPIDITGFEVSAEVEFGTTSIEYQRRREPVFTNVVLDRDNDNNVFSKSLPSSITDPENGVFEVSIPEDFYEGDSDIGIDILDNVPFGVVYISVKDNDSNTIHIDRIIIIIRRGLREL